ncbi:MAG: DegT/DnrJ/EryC1/StrS family aminotransferase [Bdellovibrionaceae bacterium]|nr:DegT/DnrJ/EryC1/StrS family aminotransferase [Pseudobdellovibrionaceae bacterium]
MRIDLPLATTTWDQAEHEALQEVIRSGRFTMGERVAKYEKEFAAYFGSKYCVMCSSGSTANLLMVAAMFFRKNNALRPGDEVIVPSVSWSTTYYPLAQYGLKLKFVDIDQSTLNFDLNELSKAITPQTRLIMAVNLLGNPNDFYQITKIIAGRNITLIEDNCESMGATLDGRQCGTFGVMGTFSSFFSHHISTMEGGCIVTDDEELYHILLCIRAHGWTRNLPKLNHVTGVKSDDEFEESFKFVLPGYNVRPLEMEGAVGSEQLKKLNQIVEVRRANAEVFQEVFAKRDYVSIQREVGNSSWFGFSFIVRGDLDRRNVIRYLTEIGVESRPIVTGNFAKNPVLKWFNHEVQGDLPNANLIDTKGFFIGNHHYDLSDKLKMLGDAMDRFFVKGMP